MEATSKAAYQAGRPPHRTGAYKAPQQISRGIIQPKAHPGAVVELYQATAASLHVSLHDAIGGTIQVDNLNENLGAASALLLEIVAGSVVWLQSCCRIGVS